MADTLSETQRFSCADLRLLELPADMLAHFLPLQGLSKMQMTCALAGQNVENGMDILTRLRANQSKVGILMLIVAAGLLCLTAIGIRDLSDSRIALPLLPLALLYVAEKCQKICYFRGMTSPTLLATASSVGFVWAVHARPSSDTLAYAFASLMAASFAFLLARMTFYEPHHLLPDGRISD